MRLFQFQITCGTNPPPWRNTPFGKWYFTTSSRYRRTRFYQWFDRNSWVWAVFSAVLAIFIYFWFITGAKWAWTPYTHYFDMLANAFLKGSVSLLEKPPAALANIANPYEYGNRKGIEYLWDSSYFKGQVLPLLGACTGFGGDGSEVDSSIHRRRSTVSVLLPGRACGGDGGYVSLVTNPILSPLPRLDNRPVHPGSLAQPADDVDHQPGYSL